MKPTNSQSIKEENAPIDNDLLKQLMDQLESQKQEIEKLKKQQSNKAGRPTKSTEMTHRDISPNDYIKIMSLIDHELNLSTEDFGRGKRLTFEYFGETKKCLYSELLAIINRHKNFFQQGKFYVLDEGKGIIKELGYDDLYEHILTKDKIEAIINSSPDAFDFFQSANKGQQAIIIDMLAVRLRDGINIDRNLIANISRASGIDIEGKVKKAKEDMEYEEGLKKLK
jgi:hypothetical protein